MNAAKKAVVNAKTFVVKHKVAIAVTVTAVSTAVVMEKLRGGALHDHVEFLENNNLMDDYLNFLTEGN